MSNSLYEPPVITVLGSVADLTLQPPGKSGPNFDGSRFLSNFSCVADQTPGSNCGGGND